MVSAPFFIAEAGVNHDGSVDKALRLVDIAADAGADAVKFQTFRAEEIASPGAARAEYQRSETHGGNQLEMLRALELDEEAHRRIARHCDDRGIEFMSTPFEIWALDLLVGLGVRRIKAPSGEITNLPLLRAMAATGLPIILSTGMADLAEVERAVAWIESEREACGFAAASGLTVLHCTSNYPTAPEDANLAAMATMRNALGLPVGYSDHTAGQPVCLAATALGATVIEKHFTEDPTDPGPDHAASIGPRELASLIANVRIVAAALGDGVKAPRSRELPIRALVRRSAFAARPLASGETLDESAIAWRRPAGDIGPESADKIRGAIVVAAIGMGEPIEWKDLAL